jgi:hypothetical protein
MGRSDNGYSFFYQESGSKSDDSRAHVQVPNTLLAKIVASYQKIIKRKGGKGDKDFPLELLH